METLTVTVAPGEIGVNSVALVIDTPDCKIFEADCSSKYPEIAAYGGVENGRDVWLCASDRSRDVIEEHRGKPTQIRFAGLSTGEFMWIAFAEASRYTVHVCLFRYTTLDVPLVWQREEAPNAG